MFTVVTAIAQGWTSKLRMAAAMESASVAGIASVGSGQLPTATVCYNSELPVPGVIIKQDEIFVEGISFSGLVCFVSLRVAKAGHVSLLFYRAKQRAGDADVLMGGFVLKRHVNSEDCASCSLTKNPRGAYDFCLRCDFPGSRTQPRYRASVSCIFTQALFCRGSCNCYR